MNTPEAVVWTKRLRRLVDPALVCYFNHARGVYTIDRCTNPEASSGLHTCSLACRRTNVLVLDEGEFPSDRAVAKLKEIDTWARFGREHAGERLVLEDAAITAAAEVARDAAVDAIWDGIRRDHRRQFRKAFHLIQQHDMHRIHN